MKIREMTIADYDEIAYLFAVTPGVTFKEADSREAIARYLERNPGLSFVAEEHGTMLGCVMCGHDGRRGYLQHLVVKPAFRRKGIGERLWMECLEKLEELGIYKTHIFVFKTNAIGNVFWTRQGWTWREDVNVYSYNVTDNENV